MSDQLYVRIRTLLRMRLCAFRVPRWGMLWEPLPGQSGDPIYPIWELPGEPTGPAGLLLDQLKEDWANE